MSAKALAALKARTMCVESAQVAYFNMDCNEVVEQLLLHLPPHSLDFCFVDPTNWQIRFDSLGRLSQDRRIDLALTFHVGAIKRCADDAPEELDDFFGDSAWRVEYLAAVQAGRREGSRVLLDAYETRLGKLGYRETNDLVLVRGPRNVPLYYLVFASKHPRGRDFWDKISLRSRTGQYRLL
ncbi:MAG: three-Cys-motif partner protein TcmP [Chloroflexota bacterium]